MTAGVARMRGRAAWLPWLLLALAWLVLPGWPAGAHAAACSGTQAVGFRTLALDDGREIAVWYPAAPASKTSAAPPAIAACAARWPLVLFSHGFAGCNQQATYITEEIARHGYVVAAPNHRDAICGLPSRRRMPAPTGSQRPSFFLPALWGPSSWRGRMLDLRQTLDRIEHDAAFGPAIDASRTGLIGHSLGGYTVLGMAGGWADWRLPGVRAVVAFAPYLLPFLDRQRLRDLHAPVMYQVGSLDFGITPAVVRAGGAFDASPAPKVLLEIPDVGHLMWTGWPCRGQASIAACIAHVGSARQVDAFTLAFLDRHLKGEAVALPAPGRSRLRADPGRD